MPTIFYFFHKTHWNNFNLCHHFPNHICDFSHPIQTLFLNSIEPFQLYTQHIIELLTLSLKFNSLITQQWDFNNLFKVWFKFSFLNLIFSFLITQFIFSSTVLKDLKTFFYFHPSYLLSEAFHHLSSKGSNWKKKNWKENFVKSVHDCFCHYFLHKRLRDSLKRFFSLFLRIYPPLLLIKSCLQCGWSWKVMRKIFKTFLNTFAYLFFAFIWQSC